MYIGSGLVLEAPQTGENVMITALKPGSFWQRNTVAIRRVAS
jgi:cell wall-associated NlpC family hydrolase